MGITGATLKRLAADSSGFSTKNHRSYLAEAAACLTDTGDPIAALRLLLAMWDTYATRPEQQAALNDIGKWLEDRLHRDPRIHVKDMALELGWVRRFAQIADDAHKHEHRRERPAHGAPRPAISFGKRIESIAARRATPDVARPERAPAGQPSKAPPPSPKALPAVFQAQFVSFSDAREARKTAQKRQQAGKQAKDRLLPIRPTAPELAALAADLFCSLLQTAGFDAPFEAAERAHGAEQPFYVTAIEERDGKRLARSIALTPRS